MQAFVLMLFFFFSCSNEDMERPTTEAITKQLQNDIKLEQFANKNLVVNWESLQKTEKDSSEIYEIEVTEKIKSEMVSKVLQKEAKYELIAIKNKNEIHSYLIEVFSNLNYKIFPGSIRNLNKFAGTLNVYGLDGTRIGHLVVFEGKAENPSKNSALDPLVTTINLFHKASLTSRVPQCNMILSTYNVVEVWTGRYSVTTLASTGQVLNIKYLGETLTSRTATLLYSEVLPCGSSGDQEPESATLHRIRTEQYETKVVDDEIFVDQTLKNNPCLFGVYTKLGGVDTFQKYLEKFDGKFSVANLKFSLGVDPKYPNASAVTSPPNNYLIEIKFNPNFLNSPQLNIARTFIHEIIHAEMFRQLLSVAGKPNISWSAAFINSVKDDFPVLADYYTRYQFNVPAGQKPTSAQHELMADHYRDVIIQGMKEFDPTQSAATYNALSWVGLMGSGLVDKVVTGLPPQPTVAWANTTQNKRLEILKIYDNFIQKNIPCQK